MRKTARDVKSRVLRIERKFVQSMTRFAYLTQVGRGMKSDINKILTYIIYVLLGIIVVGTLIAIVTGKANLSQRYRRRDPSGVAEIFSKNGAEMQEFKEFGTLRALTKPESDSVSNGVNLVVTPWLSYQKADSAFYEELAHKKKKLETIFLSYFASRTQKELFSLGEKNIKKELCNLVNEQLVLGKVDAVYFDDYIFLE